MKAIIITIGDEILIGQIIDSNSAWLAESLQSLNVQVIKIMSISDDDDDIRQSLKYACEMADLVLLTGGLGPTKDDITKKSIASFLGVEMKYDEELHDLIKEMFKRFGRKPTEAHRLQSFMPDGVEKLTNKMGTAPGMLFRTEDAMILSMPGVPYEMKYIFEKSFTPILTSMQQDVAVYHKTIQTAGRGESVIADTIDHIVSDFPEYIKIAYLPSLGKVRLRLSGKHHDQNLLESQINGYTSAIVKEIPDLVFGYDEDSLESVVQDLFIQKKLSLSTAESCTGGNIAKMLVSIPGSSAFFNGGVVAYSYELKRSMLNVSPAVLEKFGAVSEEVVKEMVDGMLELGKSDIAVAVSGIAGPGGGTPEKPVGTIHLAVGDGKSYLHRQLNLTKDRNLNIQYTSNMALLLVWKFVSDL